MLLECRNDKNASLRQGALIALEELKRPEVAPPLLRLHKLETSNRIQRRMLHATVECAPRDSDVEALILKEVAGRSALVQLHGTIALALAPSSPNILGTLRKLAGADSVSIALGGEVRAAGQGGADA